MSSGLKRMVRPILTAGSCPRSTNHHPGLSAVAVPYLRQCAVAADAYIIPTPPEYLALEGLIALMAAVDRIHEGIAQRSPVQDGISDGWRKVRPFDAKRQAGGCLTSRSISKIRFPFDVSAAAKLTAVVVFAV